MPNIPTKKRMSPLNHSVDGLAYALKQSELTQRQLAGAVGISTSYLSEILKGKRSAKQSLLRAMAVELNCPVVVLEAKSEVTV